MLKKVFFVKYEHFDPFFVSSGCKQTMNNMSLGKLLTDDTETVLSGK